MKKTIAEELGLAFLKLERCRWAPRDNQGIALVREICAELDAEEELEKALNKFLSILEINH